MATIVLSVVGAAIGGPLGGQIGALIGSQVDKALFAPTVRAGGPRLADLSVQASSYGQPIPRIWGAENRISGNLIWSTGLIETKTTTKQGGKGGGSRTTTTTYSYHVDCAIALCRGPIVRVRRIWADGKLFRDEAGVQKHASGLRIYTGTETQMPDPTMQAALGASNCPAHRGLAYVVFEQLELGDFGNRIPNFTFEVEAHSAATVATVIEELCATAGVPFLDAARADYLDLRGYGVARPETIRSALEPLRSAFFFDASEIEGELQFFPSDSTPVARVPHEDLGAHQFGTDRPPEHEATRTADIELPRQVVVQHLDPARDYQASSQRARRSTTRSGADLSVELPLVLAGRQARPYPPGRIRINGQTEPAVVAGDLILTWAHRDRTQQTAYLVQQDEGDIGPEPGTTYTVRMRDRNGVLVRTDAALAGTTWTWAVTSAALDAGVAGDTVTVEIAAERDGLTSWQAQVRTVDRTGYGLRWGQYWGGV